MNRSTLAALVVALMLGSGITGYLIGTPGDSLDRSPPPRTASTAAPAPATPAAPAAPASGPTAPAPLAQPATAPDEPFAYRRLGIDSSRADGEACLAFNKPLATNDMKYADYVRIEPEVKSALRVVDDRLCVGGLTYGQDYKVKLLAGFPGRDGAKLDAERTVDVAMGARPAVVTLPGKGFILPRGSAAGLPITTINVSKVGVAVYRVNERAIERFASDRYDATFPGTEPVTDSWSLRSWLNGSNGVRLWRGTMEVRNVANQPIVTAFPIRETIKDWKPGAYFVVVWNSARPPSQNDDDEEDQAGAGASGLWLIDTDIALTTFSGDDGLNVFARSLQSALPLPGLEVVLLSRGNEPIAKAITAADGRASFAAGLMKGRGAAEPAAVMASDTAKQEFSRLELSKAAFDLSDRGIEGRAQPGPVDAFLYTERGIYRPGETVQLMALLRDDGATALSNMPVTLIVKRPDGTEFTRFVHALQAAGAVHQAIDLPKSSRRGRWSVAAHIDPRAAPVGRVDFSVEDFVPEKLKVEFTSDEAILRPGQANGFAISADFLYGAPASGLAVEADMRVIVDDQPFPAFAKYRFGPEAEREKFEPPFISLTAPETDEAGKSRLEWGGDQVKDTVLPLKAQLTARVFEPGGGRATKADKVIPMRSRDAYLGIRPVFEGRYSREGTDTEFDIVAVDSMGAQIARPAVEYRIDRIEYTYQWYQVDGRWRWQTIPNERLLIADTIALKADAPVRLARRLTWGPHRLTIVDSENDTSSSMMFYVGWYGGGAAEETPDTLRVASDRQNYAPGDTARLRIEAPFAGEALIAIATDRIVTTYTVQVPVGGTTIDVPMKAEWGAGAYALVTAWRPLSVAADRTPTRAIGAAWLGLDPALRTLGVQIAAPEKVTPRQRIEVPVRVANLKGEEAFITLAAVDEGILQLTRFRTPNPAEFYFGKRQLGVAMRDDYGRLLDGRADDLGRIRSGGDSGDIGGLDIVPTRTVALFSGPVKLDDKGEARIALDIPDFIGQLRLMAVAYSKSRVGSAEHRLFVRDAVTADVVLPRFLAPADHGRVALSLHNVEGQAGDYRVTMEATGAVALERPVAETRRLAANQRELLSWSLRAGDPGFGKVTVSVAGPGNFAVKREWNIQVRAAQTPSAIDTVAQLDPGRELALDRNVTAPFAPGTTVVSVALSRTPGIDVPALLRALDKYPYGCLEQTTSRALPLLYYNDVALLGYGPSDPRIGDRVQDAVYRIVDMQISDGSFGMWGPFGNSAAEWLQAYALDFLLRARDQQMAVPAASLQRGLTWLNRTVDRLSPNAQAYAWYVLAKAGLADPGRVRYFQDTKGSEIKGGLAWAQLAAALNQVGEPGRARLAFGLARQRIDERDPNDYYGSPLRNRAALLTLASEAGGREGVTQVVASVRERLTARIDETTTQEQAWLVLAARALAGGGDFAYSVDGEPRKSTTEPVVINPDQATIDRGLRVRNDGERAVWMQVTARGVPHEPLPAGANGFSVTRRHLTLGGEPADLAQVRQNDRLIVSVRGRNLEGGYHEVALLDLLPAGFEIEAVLNEETVKSFPFLSKLTIPRIAEARDDRFFASFDLGDRPYRTWWDETRRFGHSYHLAYIVRAVTPGTFTLPAVNVSDMYAPRVYARSAMGHVTVAPR
ncbi:MAG: alpha-2-macroglobulin [Reyranella sp.]|nr:alpha-2-macroglobulin [Reyranella sp.]